MSNSKSKFNKTYEIVRMMKENGELYQKYIDRKIKLKDISEMYGVTYEHLANVLKENNLGNPKVERRMRTESELLQVENDINNALPIDYFKSRYTMFNGISSTMYIFNSLNRRIVKFNEISPDIQMITMHRLTILVNKIKILKSLLEYNISPRGRKKTLQEIAEEFDVSYTQVAYISSNYKKKPNTLLPDKDPELVKVIMRNLEISEDIKNSTLNHDNAIEDIAEKYNIDAAMVERIIGCKEYADNSGQYSHLFEFWIISWYFCVKGGVADVYYIVISIFISDFNTDI